MFPVLEAYVNVTLDRSKGNGLEGQLCSSVDEDMVNKKLVYHLRPGILFHDMTELTADVAIFWYQRAVDQGGLWGLNYWNGINKVDDYTFEIHFTEYSNMLIQNWAWSFPMSMEAYLEGTGGSDDQAVQNEWLENNCIGTGPFVLKEYVRDDHMLFERFEHYWQPGLPYLDGIYVRYIPDAVTARAIMEAGQADYWMGGTARDLAEMQEEGFQRLSGWAGILLDIYPNTSDPESPWNDVNLRYALEYALDKAAIAQAIGFGQYEPMYQLAPPGEWGYDPNYPERRYDVAKAKEYLTKAGYPEGIQTSLLIGNDSVSLDAGTAIKGYLDAAGIFTELDVADPGRYNMAMWGTPLPGLLWGISGMDVTNLLTYMRWFSTDPFANVRYLGRTEEQRPLDERAKAAPTYEEQTAITEEIYKYMNDNARLIPVYWVPAYHIAAPYVRGSLYGQYGLVRWPTELIWMEPH
jgi:peptide/nickel transport system substrate-binding protein